MKSRHVILLLSVALFASFAGALAYRYTFSPALSQVNQASTATEPSSFDLIGQRRPDFTIGSDTGEWVSADQFDGKLTLLNFWATWCAPCRKEMPMLIDLYDELSGQGFEVVGVAMDDVQQARDFAGEIGVNYPILVGSTDVMVMVQSYGNLSGVLPYSVLIDQDGIIRWAHTGELEPEELKRQVKKRL